MSQLHTESTSSTTTRGRMSPMAVWALVLAVLTLGGLGSVLGMVLGAKARTRIRQTGERGGALATAAIVVGAITLLLAIGYWVAIFGGTGDGAGGGGGGTGY